MENEKIRSFIYDFKLKSGKRAQTVVQITEPPGEVSSDQDIVEDLISRTPGVMFVALREITQDVTSEQLEQYARGKLKLRGRWVCTNPDEVFSMTAGMKINKTTKGRLN